ncbi:MAG: hypothetical protein P8H23_06545 [Flavobacteriaceae bacterium]|jgi:hypothetical protein|nr:hypothetical protein [Flavobacteriaceae bacterium]
MKAASVVEIKKTLEQLDKEHIKQLCLRLARFKIENKELLTYLLFEADDEDHYVQSIKNQLDDLFDEINTKSYFYIKKSVRKILRRIKKFARYSNSPETEVELLLYVCLKMNNISPSIFKNKTLTNIYIRQIVSAEKKTSKLHEDLQYEYNLQIEELKL